MTTPNPSRSVSPEPTKGERIEQIRERVGLAVQGEWWVDDAVMRGVLTLRDGTGDSFGEVCGTRTIDHDTADFIAHARADVPWLLDQLAAYIPLVEAVREYDEARKAYAAWDDTSGDRLAAAGAAVVAALVQVPGQQQADTEQGGG